MKRERERKGDEEEAGRARGEKTPKCEAKSLSKDSSNRQQCIDFSGQIFLRWPRFSVTASDWKREQLEGARTRWTARQHSSACSAR
jgi:hypothetical protein